MLRTIITTGAAMLLSLAFLAACEVDTNDDSDGDSGTDEVEETTTSEEEESEETATGEEESDETVTEEEEESDSTTPEGDDGDAETPTETEGGETDETSTPEDEAEETATSDDEESEGTEEGDESASGDAVEVTLSEFDIEVESTLESGEAVLSVTNESEGLLGLAIERGGGSGEDGDDEDSSEVIHAINVDGGETRELEVDLEAGEYTFFCPIGELRETEDMETDVTVE